MRFMDRAPPVNPARMGGMVIMPTIVLNNRHQRGPSEAVRPEMGMLLTCLAELSGQR